MDEMKTPKELLESENHFFQKQIAITTEMIQNIFPFNYTTSPRYTDELTVVIDSCSKILETFQELIKKNDAIIENFNLSEDNKQNIS